MTRRLYTFQNYPISSVPLPLGVFECETTPLSMYVRREILLCTWYIYLCLILHSTLVSFSPFRDTEHSLTLDRSSTFPSILNPSFTNTSFPLGPPTFDLLFLMSLNSPPSLSQSEYPSPQPL